MGPSAPSRHRTAPHEGPSRPSQVHPDWPAQGTAVLASVVYTGFACSRTSGAWNRPAQPLRLPSLSHHGVSETRPRRCAQLFVSAACSITKAPPTLPPVDTGPVSALFLSRTSLPWTAVRWSFGGRTGLSSVSPAGGIPGARGRHVGPTTGVQVTVYPPVLWGERDPWFVALANNSTTADFKLPT